MTENINNENIIKFNPDPSREEAMQAVKTLIAWGLEIILIVKD